MNYYGTISLTKLGDWVRKHPEQVKEVTFRDGHTEKMVNIDVRDRQQPSNFGDVAYISLYDKATNDKAYIADLKVSKYAETATAPATATEKAVAYMEATTAPAPNAAPAPQLSKAANKVADMFQAAPIAPTKKTQKDFNQPDESDGLPF